MPYYIEPFAPDKTKSNHKILLVKAIREQVWHSDGTSFSLTFAKNIAEGKDELIVDNLPEKNEYLDYKIKDYWEE